MDSLQNRHQEVDIIGTLGKVLKEKRLLLTTFIISSIVGIVIALNNPKFYTANVVLAPEVSSSIGLSESLSDMASMVGFDISSKGNSMDAIYPEIYPDLFASSDFIITLFDVKIHTLEDSITKTYREHLSQDFKIPFWSYPKLMLKRLITKKEIKKNATLNPFQLTRNEYETCKQVMGSISCLVDKKTSVITIGFTDNDPMVAALMADTIQHRLQQYITDYRTKKAKNDVRFYEQLYEDSKIEYEKSKRKYARYADSHINLFLESYKVEQEDLENDMQLKYNVLCQAEQQLRVSKEKVQDRTPAFTIIQGATVPIKASSVPRMFQVIVVVFLGFIFDVVWVLYRQGHTLNFGNKNDKNKND